MDPSTDTRPGAAGAAPGGHAVSLRDVSKSYGSVKVLDIPSLDLARGQIVAVVGRTVPASPP